MLTSLVWKSFILEQVLPSLGDIGCETSFRLDAFELRAAANDRHRESMSSTKKEYL
jgi:hypothetical protein